MWRARKIAACGTSASLLASRPETDGRRLPGTSARKGAETMGNGVSIAAVLACALALGGLTPAAMGKLVTSL